MHLTAWRRLHSRNGHEMTSSSTPASLKWRCCALSPDTQGRAHTRDHEGPDILACGCDGSFSAPRENRSGRASTSIRNLSSSKAQCWSWSPVTIWKHKRFGGNAFWHVYEMGMCWWFVQSSHHEAFWTAEVDSSTPDLVLLRLHGEKTFAHAEWNALLSTTLRAPWRLKLFLSHLCLGTWKGADLLWPWATGCHYVPPALQVCGSALLRMTFAHSSGVKPQFRVTWSTDPAPPLPLDAPHTPIWMPDFHFLTSLSSGFMGATK